mgnify:CR=1 FL=1|tara:strand:- start:5741 stop:6199 length:459 start_codon:yes stop_codon:yes gene_type:complete
MLTQRLPASIVVPAVNHDIQTCKDLLRDNVCKLEHATRMVCIEFINDDYKGYANDIVALAFKTHVLNLHPDHHIIASLSKYVDTTVIDRKPALINLLRKLLEIGAEDHKVRRAIVRASEHTDNLIPTTTKGTLELVKQVCNKDDRNSRRARR